MATAIIDGITTRYDVVRSGPPLLMFSPAGFDATLEKWTTQSVYATTKMLDHLSKNYSCIIYDRREAGQSGGRVEHITWANYVAQGKGLLEHLNVKRAHLMGGCMGGSSGSCLCRCSSGNGCEHDSVLVVGGEISHQRSEAICGPPGVR